MEYPKTENLWASNGLQGRDYARGPEFGFKLDSFGQIDRWLVTEKVDGMNMRVRFQPYGWSDDPEAPVLDFLGRTDRANIPGDLLTYMSETFSVEQMLGAFDYGEYSDELGYAWQHQVTLFGEGYGPGIQKAGQAYADITGGQKRFILFDVLVRSPSGEWWLSWENVCDVAHKLGIPTVPVLAVNADLDLIQMLVEDRASALQLPGGEHVEGVVARTDPYLFDGRGRRVMFKHKVRDLVAVPLAGR